MAIQASEDAGLLLLDLLVFQETQVFLQDVVICKVGSIDTNTVGVEGKPRACPVAGPSQVLPEHGLFPPLSAPQTREAGPMAPGQRGGLACAFSAVVSESPASPSLGLPICKEASVGSPCGVCLAPSRSSGLDGVAVFNTSSRGVLPKD